jgi:hypothetical protein
MKLRWWREDIDDKTLPETMQMFYKGYNYEKEKTKN